MKPSPLSKFLLLCILCLALTACGRTEKKAQLLFDQAAQTEQAGDSTGAITQYQQLLSTYPKSKAAEQAQAAIARLQAQIEAEKQAALAAEAARTFKNLSYKAIDSIVKVIDGYKAMFNRLPRKSKDFDNSMFFFDRTYLAETVPADFTVYLALNTADAYRLYSLKGEGDDCYRLEGKGQVFTKLGRSEALQEIAMQFVEEGRLGRLVFLKGKKP
jgi:hypothetical protein